MDYRARQYQVVLKPYISRQGQGGTDKSGKKIGISRDDKKSEAIIQTLYQQKH